MKKITGILSALVAFAACAMFTGCASTSGAATNAFDSITIDEDEGYIYRGGLNPENYAKEEMGSLSMYVEDGVYLEADDWSKVSCFGTFINELGIGDYFSNRKKLVELYRLVFEELPMDIDGCVREVYLGKFFARGEPLVIRVYVLTPGDDAAFESDKLILLWTNALATDDGILMDYNGFVSLDYNLCNYMVLKYNRLTLDGHLSFEVFGTEDGYKSINVAKLGDYDKIEFCDALLTDELVENDEYAAEILDGIIAGNGDFALVAKLYKVDYLCSKGRLYEAGVLFEDIVAATGGEGSYNPLYIMGVINAPEK